jgi:hypothetical protein
MSYAFHSPRTLSSLLPTPFKLEVPQAIGKLRGGSGTCGSKGNGKLSAETEKGDKSIIEIVEALGIVLRHVFSSFPFRLKIRPLLKMCQLNDRVSHG